MIKGFYFFFVGLCAVSALNSCADKTEDESARSVDSNLSRPIRPVGEVVMIPSPGPRGEVFTVEYTQHAIDSLMSMPEAGQLSSPESSAKYNLTLPPKMTVPPHMLPAKNVKVAERSDSTALVTFANERAPLTAIMQLQRHTKDGVSVWLVQTVTIQHDHP